MTDAIRQACWRTLALAALFVAIGALFGAPPSLIVFLASLGGLAGLMHLAERGARARRLGHPLLAAAALWLACPAWILVSAMEALFVLVRASGSSTVVAFVTLGEVVRTQAVALLSLTVSVLMYTGPLPCVLLARLARSDRVRGALAALLLRVLDALEVRFAPAPTTPSNEGA